MLTLRLQFTERIIIEEIEFNSIAKRNLRAKNKFGMYVGISVSKLPFVSYLFLILFTLLYFYFLS